MSPMMPWALRSTRVVQNEEAGSPGGHVGPLVISIGRDGNFSCAIADWLAIIKAHANVARTPLAA